MGKYFIYSTDVLYAKNVKNQVIKSNPPNMRKKMGLKKKKKKKKETNLLQISPAKENPTVPIWLERAKIKKT
jgi:hypothetical protein